MGLLDFLFGNKAKKIEDFKSRGAIIIDVRSKGEYDGGAIPGSKNIPLQSISSKMNDIKKWNKPIITCCASGMRSASAAGILKSNGVEAMNGGGWFSLSKKL
ncbi:Rhodanese-related sulfurtransferase [Aequorivita sublithincola DSM 14238]|uniref:Rhodanese-related sulfurtransferase n=1 Tax=Aequorivita sublithincola (strain DSM 14238 / LMG 21431 / ACAM 643 / 9-3) TaxID=746697 RepID=I3YW83_AEQSU|nr:rhodanese-like domain-containing protein [Aequorivita sublithincola]AFL81251.1 Rhodanese-related sulfurtransferase [Aequorivita sublithincola DSM 14238]